MILRVNYLALILIALITLSAGQMLAEEKRETASDTWLEAQLVTSYTLNRHLNPFAIDVEVTDGVATITGTVDSEIERDLAVEIARGIEGIKEVREELLIEPVGNKKRDKSGFARRVEDATLTAKVKYRLFFNKHISSFDINVDSKNGVVTLNGTVDSGEKRDLAVKLAENTSGVDKVKDNLEVVAAEDGKQEGARRGDKGKMEALAANINDTWITTKAESLLLVSDEAKGATYDVTTENGTIILTGTVLSEKQAKNIQQLLEDLQGVNKVENRLTVR